MTAKLILEKLPLEPDDVLLVTISEKMSNEAFEKIRAMVEDVMRPRLPYKNLVMVCEFGETIQALRPIQGKFKIINEKLTVCTEENL